MEFVILFKQLIERFPKIAMTYRYMRDHMRIQEVPRETRMGFKLAGNQSMQDGIFEPEETYIVNRIIPYNDVIINVGANIGYYCCIALRHNKYVVAFEPMDINIKCLLRNIKANNWESMVEIYPLAVSDKVGVLEIYGSGTGASLVKGWAGIPDHYVTLVPSSTLDIILGLRFQGQKCFFIVDIEGAEYLMVKGANIVLDMTPKPIWMMEISITEHQPNNLKVNPNMKFIFDMFWERGYESWTADRTCRAVYPDEIEKIVKSGIDTINTHNFLFIEKGSKYNWLPEEEHR